jgi:hypothetical protein
MSRSISAAGFAIVSTLALVAAGCGSKTPPKSTTTTHSQIITETDTGESSTTDVTETRVRQKDGTQDVERTETTKKTIPKSGDKDKDD